MKMPWSRPKKVCFLCSGKFGDDYGEIEYEYYEGGKRQKDRKKICALCIAKLESREREDEQSEPI